MDTLHEVHPLLDRIIQLLLILTFSQTVAGRIELLHPNLHHAKPNQVTFCQTNPLVKYVDDVLTQGLKLLTQQPASQGFLHSLQPSNMQERDYHFFGLLREQLRQLN